MQKALKQKLADLQEALSNIDHLDEDSAELLSTLGEEIQRIQQGGTVTDNLSHKIEQETIKFEGEHPQMSAILRDIIDVLGKMGI